MCAFFSYIYTHVIELGELLGPTLSAPRLRVSIVLALQGGIVAHAHATQFRWRPMAWSTLRRSLFTVQLMYVLSTRPLFRLYLVSIPR
jgi:hypothetical protein